MKAADFLEMSRPELLATLCSGHSIDPAALDDTEYKGVSLGLPGFIERLSWKTFKKTFHRDPTAAICEVGTCGSSSTASRPPVFR